MQYITTSPMNRFQKEALKMSILKLTRMRNTGSPGELADRFEISGRTVKRLVKSLRDSGHDVFYSRSLRTYVLRKKN